MTKKDRVKEVLERLDNEYGRDDLCYLYYNSPWQLLVATMLSAQCTDDRVNMVTPALFEAYPEAKDMARADINDVKRLIHSVGFFNNKATNIIACSKDIVEKHGGIVPSSIEDLTSLPGVGRKTANVVRSHIFHDPSIVVDTHVNRISRKLGFSKSEDPVKTEQELMKVLPKDHWIRYNMQIITLGRTICKARNPKCGECFLADLCPSAGK